MNKKYLIIVVGILIVCATGYLLLKGNKSTTPEEKLIQKSEKVMDQVEDLNKQLETKKIPENLNACTPEILKNAGNCINLPEENVCGYDHTIYGDGKEKDHALTYKTTCHYCQLFGDDNLMELMDTRVQALGYKEGACQ